MKEDKNSVKIGIIGAMDSEVSALIEKSGAVSQKKAAGTEFFGGAFGNIPVIIVKCGIGKVNAAICTQVMIDAFAVTHIINTGVAGSLNSDLEIGDIVVSKDALQHDYDVSPIGFRKGEIPFTGKVNFEGDKTLCDKAMEAAKACLPKNSAVLGRVASGDQFIAESRQKSAIIETFAADCAEMEGGAIAQTAYLNNIPFVVLRAISDKADESSHKSFEEFQEEAAANSAKLVEYLVRNW